MPAVARLRKHCRPQLHYPYTSDKTHLTSVRDASGQVQGFRTTNSSQTYLYHYDNNGNVTYDESKQATIAYNYLNLPWHITTPDGEIKWVYDATGRKLKKTVLSAQHHPSITYHDGIEKYSDGSTFVHHSEGRYAYYLVDEEGNLSISLQIGHRFLHTTCNPYEGCYRALFKLN